MEGGAASVTWHPPLGVKSLAKAVSLSDDLI